MYDLQFSVIDVKMKCFVEAVTGMKHWNNNFIVLLRERTELRICKLYIAGDKREIGSPLLSSPHLQ